MKPLDSAALKSLSQIDVGRTELRTFIEFAIIFLTAFTHIHFAQPLWALPFVLLIIGSRQHALLVIVHEASHWRISKNRKYNDCFGELIAWNFLALMRGYRNHHLKHHVIEKINTMEDPDFARKQNHQWRFPMSFGQFLRIIFRDLTLLNTYDYIQEAKDAGNNKPQNQGDRKFQKYRMIYYTFFFGALVASGTLHLWLLYWLLPLLTTLKVIFRFRSICDHFETNSDTIYGKTRTITGNWMDRLLIAPCSIATHGPHHIYPSIPYYNLRKAQAVMMQNEKYRNEAVINDNYLQALLGILKGEGSHVV